MKYSLPLVSLFILGCGGLSESNLGIQGMGHSTMAITNASGEKNVLRVGTSLNMSLPEELELLPDTVYRAEVINTRTGTKLAFADLLSDMLGRVELTTVAHDIGEFDDVEPEDNLQIYIHDLALNRVADVTVPITPHESFAGHGFTIEEAQPPHVYSADAAGNPSNSFVIGGPAEQGEIAAPIYAAGKGFPAGVQVVDVYLLTDQDEWRDRAIPQQGDPLHIRGPVTGMVEGGVLTPTFIDWQPEDTGIYDIVVDVDRDGRFDYSFSEKDAADGEFKVGLTIQYGAAWQRLRRQIEGEHLVLNLAYSSSKRLKGKWNNSYGLTQQVYSYVNPPVMRQYHSSATKLVVAHQSWNKFWNNPEVVDTQDGKMRIYIADITLQQTTGSVQRGCTNSAPVSIVNPKTLPVDEQQTFTYDIVYDFNGDGYYDIGEDFLDVVADSVGGGLASPTELAKMDDSKIYGFKIAQ